MSTDPILDRIRELSASAQDGNALQVCREIHSLVSPTGRGSVRRWRGELDSIIGRVADGESVFVASERQQTADSLRAAGRRAGVQVKVTAHRRSGEVGWLVEKRDA